MNVDKTGCMRIMENVFGISSSTKFVSIALAGIIKGEAWFNMVGNTPSLQADSVINQRKLLKKDLSNKRRRKILANWQLYLLLVPAFVITAIFRYGPMYGILYAFQDFDPITGFLNSPWVGFKHFIDMFRFIKFWELIRNTLVLNFWNLLVNFPAPIILAILINEIRAKHFKKAIQTISYLPYFISTVVVIGMLVQFTTPSSGIVGYLFRLVGAEPINFFAESAWMVPIYVISGLWKDVGWGSIIFLAGLSSIDTTLYEAAIVDGASRLKRVVHVSIPGIMPTIVIMFIFAVGNMMSINFEKILLMQRPITYDTADVLQTYIYRAGIGNQQWSPTTAMGLFQTIINALLLVFANFVSRKTNETSLW